MDTRKIDKKSNARVNELCGMREGEARIGEMLSGGSDVQKQWKRLSLQKGHARSGVYSNPVSGSNSKGGFMK